MNEPRCSCDAFGEGPCPVHARENALQDEVLALRADRDEWRQQHENLLAIYQAEVAERDRVSAALNNALSVESDAVHRAESAEIGCSIAYRREPTQAEGDAHADGADECFVTMGGWTGRRCRACGRWVWGGPTACEGCVRREERDETTHLRALLAEQTARAEKAESYAGKLEIDVSGFKGTISELVDRVHAEMARAERAEAACAEMRAALERSTNAHQAALYDEDLDRDDERDAQRVIDDTHALLSRPDLGAGKVLVEREVVEEMLCGATTGFSMSSAGDSAWERLADTLRALLKKGGG